MVDYDRFLLDDTQKSVYVAVVTLEKGGDYMVLTDEERATRPLTADEAAEYLRVSRSTIIRLMKSGDLAAAKIGRQWRVKKADLDDFLEKLKKARAEGRGEK